jgi:hypothetical protein
MNWAVNLFIQETSRSLRGELCFVSLVGPASLGVTVLTLASGGGVGTGDSGGGTGGGRGDPLARGGIRQPSVVHSGQLQIEAAPWQTCIDVIHAAASQGDITAQAECARGSPARGRAHF